MHNYGENKTAIQGRLINDRLQTIYTTDMAVAWKLVRSTWHVHSTPDDNIQLRVILRRF